MDKEYKYNLSEIEESSVCVGAELYRENLGPEREMAIGLSQQLLEESADLIHRVYHFKNFWRSFSDMFNFLVQHPELSRNSRLITRVLGIKFGETLAKRIIQEGTQLYADFNFRFGNLNDLYINADRSGFSTSLVTPRSHLSVRIDDKNFLAGSERLILTREVLKGNSDYPPQNIHDETFVGILTLFSEPNGKSMLSHTQHSSDTHQLERSNRRTPLSSNNALRYASSDINTLISAYRQVSKMY